MKRINLKTILGIALMAPVVGAILYVVGIFIYAYFEFYPVAMTILTAIAMFSIGFAMIASQEEK